MAAGVPLSASVTAGDARWRVAFDKRPPAADGAGNVEGSAWEEQFRRFARVTPLKGGEEVTAARLQGMQPAIVRVRADSSTRMVTPQWRLRDINSGTAYNIKSISNEDERRIWLTMMCSAGGPD
ncbi:MAG TPA: head-tail adaptor protein [Rhizomicrobium sp.]|jgi:head-tail adaptor|nr:head-tail adaptor protein [Rhizomicrobium sp.]